MYGYLAGLAAATVIFAGVVGYAMTRRYGWGAALALPLLALLALVGMQWQEGGIGPGGGWSAMVPALGFAVPVLLGAVAGIAVARLRRG